MRLQPEERSEETRFALGAAIVFLIPLLLLAYFTHNFFATKVEKMEAIKVQTTGVFEKNHADIEEIRIIQGNQAQIDNTWRLLTKWNQGAINQESAKMLTDAGFHSVIPLLDGNRGTGLPNRSTAQKGNKPGVPRIPNRGGASGEYTKIEARSEKSEFLRVINALAKIEENEGLTQIERANLRLPVGTVPYQNKATYLDIDLLLSTPNTIR